MTNGHVQHITTEESTSIEWVKVNWYFFMGSHSVIFLFASLLNGGQLLKMEWNPFQKGKQKGIHKNCSPLEKGLENIEVYLVTVNIS